MHNPLLNPLLNPGPGPRPRPRPNHSSTFAQREEYRWIRWWKRKVHPMLFARRRRISCAAGSVSAWIRPVRSAYPNEGLHSEPHASKAVASINPTTTPVAAQLSRDDSLTELHQLIAEQAQCQLQQGAEGYLHTDDEPQDIGLSPTGELDDAQLWQTHALLLPRGAHTEYENRGMLGFVAWSAS